MNFFTSPIPGFLCCTPSDTLPFLSSKITMEPTEIRRSSQTLDLWDTYCTPCWDVPKAPPSTGVSSPYQHVTQFPPQPQDLVYVTQRLWSGSQQHTRRFSFENPAWPNDEDKLLGTPSLRYSTQDDDATNVSSSVRTQSRCSQSTLCESLDLDEDCTSIPLRSSGPSDSYYYKNLAPTPIYECAKSSPALKHSPNRPKKDSLAGTAISCPISVRQVSSPTGDGSPMCLSPVDGDRIRSWPTFVAQREAPKPPLLEEKSIWEDSDSEDEVDSTQSSRFKRRVSNPLRAFLCKGKEPRRRSA